MSKIGYWKKQHKGEGNKLLEWSNYFPENRGLPPRHIIISYEKPLWYHISDTKNIVLQSFKTKTEAKKYAIKLMKENPSGMK